MNKYTHDHWFTTDNGHKYLILDEENLPTQRAWCKHCRGRVAHAVGVVIKDGSIYYAIQCQMDDCKARFVESRHTFNYKYVGNEHSAPLYGHIPEGKRQVSHNVLPVKVIKYPSDMKKQIKEMRKGKNVKNYLADFIRRAIKKCEWCKILC